GRLGGLADRVDDAGLAHAGGGFQLVPVADGGQGLHRPGGHGGGRRRGGGGGRRPPARVAGLPAVVAAGEAEQQRCGQGAPTHLPPPHGPETYPTVAIDRLPPPPRRTPGSPTRRAAPASAPTARPARHGPDQARHVMGSWIVAVGRYGRGVRGMRLLSGPRRL